MGLPESEKSVGMLQEPSSGSDIESSPPRRSRKHSRKAHQPIQWVELVVGAAIFGWILNSYWPFPGRDAPKDKDLPSWIRYGQEQCSIIASSPPSFSPFTADRKVNERWAAEYPAGTNNDPGTWLKNATLWTGEKGGSEIKHGWGVWLKDGVIRKIGSEDEVKIAIVRELTKAAFGEGKNKITEIELNGSWVTPGMFQTSSCCC
jgi:hypothetical protein